MVIGFATDPVRILGRAQTSGNPQGPPGPTPGLPAITGLASTVIGADFFDVVWDAVVPTPDGIRVQCQASGGDWSTLLSNDLLGGSDTSAEFSIGITPNTPYDVRIRQEVGAEVSEWAELLGVLTLPAAPAGFSGSAGGPTTANLTWSGGDANTYNVYRSASIDFSGASQIASGIVGTNYSDSGGTPETTLYYWLTGSNNSGEGAPSGPVQIDFPAML